MFDSLGDPQGLIGIFLKAVFVENILLAYFLGMCSFLAISKKVESSEGLGLAVIFVLTFTAPINWRLESGDRVEINYMPRGERLVEPFDIAEDVSIPEGTYQFNRYRLEWELAAKRRLNGQLTWWFGSFFSGHLDELEASINLNPSSVLNFEFIGNHNIGRLPEGDFTQTLLGFRVRFNASPRKPRISPMNIRKDAGVMSW